MTSNYSQALKILEQQVKQYSPQLSTKELIIKVFNKLFDNGHAAFMKDLTEEQRDLFSSKVVQHFIIMGKYSPEYAHFYNSLDLPVTNSLSPCTHQ